MQGWGGGPPLFTLKRSVSFCPEELCCSEAWMPQPARHCGGLCMGTLSPSSAPGGRSGPLTGTTSMSTHSFQHLLPPLQGLNVLRFELDQFIHPQGPTRPVLQEVSQDPGDLHYELCHRLQGQLSRLWRALGPVTEVLPDWKG